MYSQTCVQGPGLGPQKSVRCSKGGRCSKVDQKYQVNLLMVQQGRGIRLVVVDRWPLFRGGRQHRFNCNTKVRVGQWYHSFNGISLSRSQSDSIKRRPLQLKKRNVHLCEIRDAVQVNTCRSESALLSLLNVKATFWQILFDTFSQSKFRKHFFENQIFEFLFPLIVLGEGHYYENQNIKNQKEHRKKFKASEHQKCLFSLSLLPHHYIKIDKDHYYKSS